MEQPIERHGKPALALADIQQKPTEGERLVILPMALHAVSRHTEANAALESLGQKFGDTYAPIIVASTIVPLAMLMR